MKIAYVISTFPPYRGGMGNSALHFANYITKFRHEAAVFTPVYKNKNKGDFINNNPQLKIIRLKPVFSFGNSAVVPQLLWRLPKYDIIHLHYPFYGGAEMVALLKIILGKKFKLILHYHMDNKAQGWKGKIFEIYRKFFLPIILRLADEITCASLDYIKHSNAGSYYQQHPNKFTPVPFGVDIEEFKPRQWPDDGIKKIIFVGGLDKAHYFKGVDILIRAFAKLKQDINIKQDLRLTIVGKGNLESYYRQVAEKLQVINYIDFLNNADDCQLVNCYQQSDVLVLPSINQSEAFGLVLLEAMACGRPVIASNLPGVRSVFRNNQEGLLVKPNDIDDLTEKLKRILTNDQLALSYGQAARQLVEEKYTWDKTAEKLNETYYRVKNTLKVKPKNNIRS